MLLHQPQPRASQFVLDALRRDARRARRPSRRIELEVDHRDPSAGRERGGQAPEVRGALLDVVVDVHQQHHVHLLRQPRIFRHALDRLQVRQALLAGALAQVLDHVGLHVHRVHLALRQHVRQANGKIARPRPDVGDLGVGRELERLDDFMRLLPGVALRVVEDARPALGVLEPVLRVRVLRGRRPRNGRSQGREHENPCKINRSNHCQPRREH